MTGENVPLVYKDFELCNHLAEDGDELQQEEEEEEEEAHDVVMCGEE